MSDRDENGRRIPDHDELEEAGEQRRNSVWCKCGYPDWPGSCPGWRNCPVHGEEAAAKGETVSESVPPDDDDSDHPQAGGRPYARTKP